jgi:hypothetical protein
MRVAQEENRESTDADHVSTEELDWAVAKIHQEDQSVLRELAERESVEPQLQTLHFIHFAHKRLALTPTLPQQLARTAAISGERRRSIRQLDAADPFGPAGISFHREEKDAPASSGLRCSRVATPGHSSFSRWSD